MCVTQSHSPNNTVYGHTRDAANKNGLIGAGGSCFIVYLSNTNVKSRHKTKIQITTKATKGHICRPQIEIG